MKDFTCRVQLRWGDMDAMAHINNVVYFRLMEEARIQWFAQMGFSTLPQGEAPILAHASCDFMRALNYPGDAVVTQQVTRVGRSSIEMQVRIEHAAEPGVEYARGRCVVVWYDYDKAASAPWPAAILARLT
jgi:acyl-CoA thioester hydrolase